MKMWRHMRQWRLRDALATISGALTGALIARLVLKLFAARPDSPAVQWLYALTDPFVAPLMMIDRDQPRFGAVLELSTLATLGVIVSVTALLWIWLGAREQSDSANKERAPVVMRSSAHE